MAIHNSANNRAIYAFGVGPEILHSETVSYLILNKRPFPSSKLLFTNNLHLTEGVKIKYLHPVVQTSAAIETCL